MATQGPNSPANGYSLDRGAVPIEGEPSLVHWDNANGIINPFDISAAGIYGVAQASHILQSAGHGFDIPADATDIRVQVDLLLQSTSGDIVNPSAGSAATIVDVELVQSVTDSLFDTVSYRYVAVDVPTGVASEYYSFGGPDDTWDNSLTPAIINASGFGAAFRATTCPDGPAPSFNCDHVQITVWYTVSVNRRQTRWMRSIN